MKEQKTPTKELVGGGGKGFVLYFNCKIANPRIMFTFMFSVVQSLDHLIQTSAFSSLAASLTEGRDRSCSMPVAESCQGMNFLIEVGFPWERRENLCWTVFHDCLTLFLWSKVEMGNGFISKLCLTRCPLVVSIMSHPFGCCPGLSSWNAGENTFPEKTSKLLANDWNCNVGIN